MTIWTYPFDVTDEFEQLMPAGAKVLSVQVQNGQPCMWALVDAAERDEVRKFRVVGTGHPIENSHALQFVGTFQIHGGMLVFHLCEEL
jgi:hypothetical protein